jgi:hypothetical protein
MPSERKKIIVLSLFWSAVTINVMSFLFDFMHRSAFATFLFNIGLTRYGWLPAIVFLGASLTLTILWKPYTRVIRIFIITFSILMLIYDLIWLAGIYFISHLNP